jgi:ribosome-associated toxin RatA of RatAB toxin-antitoxin module
VYEDRPKLLANVKVMFDGIPKTFNTLNVIYPANVVSTTEKVVDVERSVHGVKVVAELLNNALHAAKR